MKLSRLIMNCALSAPLADQVTPSFDPEISNISANSREIKDGGLFIAAKGLDGDGHDYISHAFKNGAAAVVAQKNPDNLDNIILVRDSRMETATIAAQFYGHPTKEMVVIGITGTNGKTTITWLLESILNACGHATGVIGTVNIRYNDIHIDNPYTTPDPIYLQEILRKMKDAGTSHVVMEVSSHGLALNRVDHIHFDAGVFTNLSQDHLDFHSDMDDYFSAKKRLFTHFLGRAFNPNAPAVINLDDAYGKKLFTSIACRTFGVSKREEPAAVIRSEDTEVTIQGISGTIRFDSERIPFTSPLTGGFNLENILCAAGAAYGIGLRPDMIVKGIENCSSIPGRLEKVASTTGRHYFVDYAHTPDALASALDTISKNAAKRVLTVFGCGGDRDRKKRPLMGQAACRKSDIAIVTSDNPRTEDPDRIITDIVEGLDEFDTLTDPDIETHPFKKGYMVVPDRRLAIRKAVDISKPGDIILVAGKGHETYQITNQGTIHFDDREELRSAELNFSKQFEPIPWQIEDLVTALDTSLTAAEIEPDFVFSGISTDSRTIEPSQLFLALKGENFDAHTFIPELAENGIKGFIVQKGFLDSLRADSKTDLLGRKILLFETENTLTSLGDLARFQRKRAGVSVVAITGSSGKTSTRQVTESVFNTRFHTLATQGNLNNEIGLPLTLLKLSYAHEWAVVEMGMNHAGEIARLTRIALPDIAMVINTAAVHLEGLGTVENVANAKAEIFQGLGPNSTAVIFADDERRSILEETARSNNQIAHFCFFGSADDADIRISSITRGTEGTDFKAEIEGEIHRFFVPSPARFMVNNCLAAIGAARAAGIDIESIQRGIQAFTPVAGRLNISRIGRGIHLIDDTYNANPASVTQAMQTMKDLAGSSQSIAVLGDMLELGETAAEHHETIGKTVAALDISQLYVFGPMGEYTVKGAAANGLPEDNIYHGSKETIAEKVADIAGNGTWILVKGSRGMAMEVVVKKLKNILTLKS